MGIVVWMAVGVLVAVLMGASPQGRGYRPFGTSTMFAGIFGALVGGVLSDGIAGIGLRSLTWLSVLGAALGALVLCWAIRERESDANP